MKCIGITKNFKDCNNKTKFLYCRHHKFQIIAVLTVIAMFGGLYQDILRPLLFSEEVSLTAWGEITASDEAGWENIIQLQENNDESVDVKQITTEEAKAKCDAYEKAGNFRAAIVSCNVAMKKKPNDFNNLAHISQLYVALGNYKKSILLQKEAIESLMSIEMSFNKFSTIAGKMFYILGNINERNKDKKSAFESYTKAEFFAEHSKNKRIIDDIKAKRDSFNTASVITSAQISYDRAVENYGVHSEEAATKLNNLAQAYKKSGDLINARKYSMQVIRILETGVSDNHLKLAMAYINFAALIESEKKYSESDVYFYKALEKLGPNRNEIGFNFMYNMAIEAMVNDELDRMKVAIKRANIYAMLLPESSKKNAISSLENIKNHLTKRSN